MVFFVEAFDKHVINIHLYSFTDQFSKDFIDKALICRPSILQAKQHNFVAIKVVIYGERHLIFIIKAHAYLVVTRVRIHEA